MAEKTFEILVINGPNLNMLGIREPAIYGNDSYADLCDFIKMSALPLKLDVTLFQSNHEGAIIDEIQNALGKFDGIVINPGAYTHYSYAIADALSAVQIPTVEVHISDISKREDFRKLSVISPVSIATVKGKGFYGYREALEILKGALEK
ncbi:MAG: type II 3-dehydroquinate dehydratase [Clostridia bacterium]|nr:type II 3-dehydroquinate dehydratase [Clostridia bacterium]